MIRPVTIAAALLLAAATGGCSVLPGGSGTYGVTVYFARTPSLYEQSSVKVLGADAGTVTSITDERTRVRVELAVNREVPLPRDVNAVIESANTLGERFVSLEPAWKPGKPKAEPGAVVPQERTRLPVEIDDALDAFAKLNRSLDPEALGSAVHRGADGLRGHGAGINRGLGATSRLTGKLAAQDEKIVSLAEGLRSLAATLNDRDQRLEELLRSFSTTSRSLSEERTRLREFVSGLAAAIEKSGVLITAYRETLPDAMTDLSNIVLTLKGNAGALNQAIAALEQFTKVADQAWDRENNVVTIRAVLSATVRAWLQPLFTAMGWGAVPCPAGDTAIANCVPGPGGGRR
ncbi:MCE family protein [Spirillospora sp. NPDC048819]|uniref:MCE family protein n=1 Tax=Spirillospora sp. NPDC048819 TaxID=3155268 RepID=UPI00340AD9F9